MKTEELEEMVKEIREKEEILEDIKVGNILAIGRQGMREFYHVLTLSKEELDVLKELCLSRIKELKEKIKTKI